MLLIVTFVDCMFSGNPVGLGENKPFTRNITQHRLQQASQVSAPCNKALA